MKIITITPAFCPAAQLARSIIEYRKYREVVPEKHIVVDCHYPLDRKNNSRDLRLVCESLGDIEFWDSEKDLGSAQTQNWVLNELAHTLDESYAFINLDPDASCRSQGWDFAMREIMIADPACALVSCNAPMVIGFVERRHQNMEKKIIGGQNVFSLDVPTPFNLSMWRYSFFSSIGGIPQKFPYYGEVEGPVWATIRAYGSHSVYLQDYFENEDGKLMHSPHFEKWKDLHARTEGPEAFLGNFEEYCESKGLINAGI